ncbi:hypothetical protein V8J82_07145 [Gymnodinialimonas sp. 2305UL16-5]|uniref:hypothetical protein n=1 Tax=Gymnodinialimonas mytili TaxID=3126503 RepID=UPI00309BF14F
MRALTLGIAIGICLGGPGLAQTIPIQSGDHAGFTRLVLPIGGNRDWSLQRIDDTEWALELMPSVDGFDTSQIFNLIQRNRLADVTTEDGLSLSLACNCTVTAFRYDTRFLVVDIADPEPDAPAAELEEARAAERAAAASALPNLAQLLPGRAVQGFDPEIAMSDPGQIPDQPVAEEPAPLETATAADLPRQDIPNPRIAEAAEIMAEQLARAAASGLLDAALDQPLTVADPVAEPLPTEIPEFAPNPEEPGAEDMAENIPDTPDLFPTGPLPIRAESALDAGLNIELSRPTRAVPGSCTGATFNIRDWATGAGFEQDLGELRDGLYDERDNLVLSIAEDLARHYIYYGFGAEAIFWLDQIPEAPLDLRYVAALLDGAERTGFPSVTVPSDCSDGELLWRYLANAVEPDLLPEEVDAVQRGFHALPPSLRDHIGPSLARRFHSDDEVSATRNVREALHRGGRLDAAVLRILDIDIDIAPDRSPDETRIALEEAVRDDGGDPVTVMARALLFDRMNGTLPSPDRLVAAEALLRETGPGRASDELWREALIGYAAIGQIDRALEMLTSANHGAEARNEALTDLIAERVSVGDIAALVILAYRYGNEWQPVGSEARRAQLNAIAVLREADLFVAADILRDTRQPLILPLTESEPSEVPNPAQQAWRERNWSELAETGRGVHADIANYMLRLTDPVGLPDIAEPVDLTGLNSSVSESRDLRAAINAILDQPAPTE